MQVAKNCLTKEHMSILKGFADFEISVIYSNRWDAHFALQLGLRGFSGRHSLELGVKIPLTSMGKSYTNPDSTELNNAYTQYGLNPADFDTTFEVKLKQRYNAFLRYVFSF